MTKNKFYHFIDTNKLRKRLRRYKDQEKYTQNRKNYFWKNIAKESGLGEPWLHKFTHNKCVDYKNEYLIKLTKFLDKKGG